MNSIKNLSARLFMVAAVLMFSNTAMAKKPLTAKVPTSVPTIGITADGSYPVYKLEGAPNSPFYVTSGHLIFNGDLKRMMITIMHHDVNKNGYTCHFLCSNARGQVVGINPMYDGELYYAKKLDNVTPSAPPAPVEGHASLN